MLELLRNLYYLSLADIGNYLGLVKSGYYLLEEKKIGEVKIIYIIKLCVLYDVSFNFIIDASKYEKLNRKDRDNYIKKFNIDTNKLRKLKRKIASYNLDLSTVDFEREKRNIKINNIK